MGAADMAQLSEILELPANGLIDMAMPAADAMGVKVPESCVHDHFDFFWQHNCFRTFF
jgi:hypothetical protein